MTTIQSVAYFSDALSAMVRRLERTERALQVIFVKTNGLDDDRLVSDINVDFVLERVEEGRWPVAEEPTSVLPSPGTFGWAIDQLKIGEKLRRHGWNGKGMYLVFSAEKTITNQTATGEHTDQHGALAKAEPVFGESLSIQPAETRTIGARIDIMAADGVIEVGWRPTSRDMLATDWEVC